MTETPAAGPVAPALRGALDAAVFQALEWGLVEIADIVDGDLRISSSSRRNLNLRIERLNKPSYLVKRDDLAGAGSRTLENETGFYRFCKSEPAAAGVAASMPPLVDSFDSGRTLVLELVTNSRSLWQAYSACRGPELPANPARALGRVLGDLHSAFEGAVAEIGPSGGSPEAPPYFSIHEPHPAALRTMSPARLELCHCLQREPGLSDGLTAARAAWRAHTVIHGDVRSENVLLVEAGSEPERVLLVDWEFVQRGDPAWDLGCVFEDHVRFWLQGMSQRADLEPAERIATASWPLPEVQTLVRAVCAGYVQAQPGTPMEGRIRRAVTFSAVRLLQTAWEHCRYLDRLSSLSVLMIQVAANILADPETAAASTYGLDRSNDA